MSENQNGNWPLWEVFVRSSRGLSHVHAGSLHAPDATMAVRNARDLYTRRNEGTSVWVVPADAITASDPDSKGGYFESCLLYTSPSPRDVEESRMPSSA